MKRHPLSATLTLLLALGACTPSTEPVVPAVPAPTAKPAPVLAELSPIDQRPALAPPKVFEPPAPEVFRLANGVTVWLVEKHALPLVAVTLAVPSGSSSDPADMPGLAHITADMLDEGAGKRGPIEISSALNDLGASLAVSNTADGTFVGLSSLKKNFAPAFAILGDIVVRPRFDPKEWKRVSGLWQNALQKRADDPVAVAGVVWTAAHYGPGTPYGHPADGLLRGAAAASLPAVKAFYQANFTPERAVLVVAGDITRKEVTDLAEASLKGWKAPAKAAARRPALVPAPAQARPRLVLVDRPEAPQSVIEVAREGVSASDPQAPPLDLVNTALGGSFTSRLNQNLREDHGWSYGARSGFTEVRGKGAFIARAAVQTEFTGPAMKEMLGELEKMAAQGMTSEEIDKVRAQDRADLVQTYETVDGVARRLATLAALGLPPSFDAKASVARQAATPAELAALARDHVGTKDAVIVVVGPREKVAPQLAAIGLTAPEIWSPEGEPVPAKK